MYWSENSEVIIHIKQATRAYSALKPSRERESCRPIKPGASKRRCLGPVTRSRHKMNSIAQAAISAHIPRLGFLRPSAYTGTAAAMGKAASSGRSRSYRMS